MKAGIGIGPAYSVEGLRYILHHVDWLILMSVEPGYGGQTLEESVYEKIHQAKALMDELGHHVPISIDGGVNDVTGKKLIEAGADILIAGSYIFKDNKVAERVQTLKAL